MPSETAVAWGFFEVVAERNPPTKQHPDVSCRQCHQFIRNAQLGRDILQHAAYKCPSATTAMIDTARRLIYQKTTRKAAKGDRVARMKLMLGDAGEPSWMRRNEKLHPWVSGFVSDESEDDERDEIRPSATKKQRVSKGPVKKTGLGTKPAARKFSKVATQNAQGGKENENENELNLAIAEAFRAAGIPYSTIETTPFRKMVKVCNPLVQIPTRNDLQSVLPEQTSTVQVENHAKEVASSRENPAT